LHDELISDPPDATPYIAIYSGRGRRFREKSKTKVTKHGCPKMIDEDICPFYITMDYSVEVQIVETFSDTKSELNTVDIRVVFEIGTGLAVGHPGRDEAPCFTGWRGLAD